METSPTVTSAFDAWWPRHAVRHNSRSPVAAREAFDAGWQAACEAVRQRICDQGSLIAAAWLADTLSEMSDTRS